MNITTLRQEVLYLLCKYGLISKKNIGIVVHSH